MSEEMIKNEGDVSVGKTTVTTDEEIFRIIDRFESSDIAKLKFKKGDMLLELEKAVATPGGDPCAPANIGGGTVLQEREKAEPVTVEASESEAGGKMAGEEQEGTVLSSPIAGVFYAAPSPGSAPYVKTGQHVKKGDVVGLVEAMKMMNEITAPVSGVVKVIDVKNEDFVEYKQSLMIISPV